jgi:hypothetical protein
VIIIVAIVLTLTLWIAWEAARWLLRPEARRLRALKKIGGRR